MAAKTAPIADVMTVLGQLDDQANRVLARQTELDALTQVLAGPPGRNGGRTGGTIAQLKQKIADLRAPATRHGVAADTAEIEQEVIDRERQLAEAVAEYSSCNAALHQIEQDRERVQNERRDELVDRAVKIAANAAVELEAVTVAARKANTARRAVITSLGLASRGFPDIDERRTLIRELGFPFTGPGPVVEELWRSVDQLADRTTDHRPDNKDT